MFKAAFVSSPDEGRNCFGSEKKWALEGKTDSEVGSRRKSTHLKARGYDVSAGLAQGPNRRCFLDRVKP
jgi:hypothetical protein